MNYEKYWWALGKLLQCLKNDYDNNDRVDEGKNKQFGYRQFELFNKTDKKSKLDEKKKKGGIENREKDVHKKGFIKYFSNEPTTLVNNLLSKKTQDL